MAPKLFLSSAMMAAASAVFAALALARWREITAFGPLCGHTAAGLHCGWCYAAVVSLAVSGLLALAGAVRTHPAGLSAA